VIAAWHFLWVSTRGYRLSPWRSPYLRWRIETYSGLPAAQIGFTEFWSFLWKERKRLARFLGWVGEMEAWRKDRSLTVAAQ
jgi:hypothetical protein